MLISYLRGKHIVFSSGADSISQLRGPFDVTNIAQMLDIKREQALQCNKQNGIRVLQHGEARRRKYSQISIVSVERNSSGTGTGGISTKRKRVDGDKDEGQWDVGTDEHLSAT